MKQAYLCIDLGGTKTAIGLYGENKEEYFYQVIPTNPENGALDLLERIDSLLPKEYSFIRGTIASPGPLDCEAGKIVNVVTMGWQDIPIVKLLEEKFGCSFNLLNDCSAGALGVWSYDAKKEANNLCYISLSTGVGGGIIINKKLYLGNGNAAEIGHLSVSNDGRMCGCGNHDCLELYASGSGIANLYYEKTGVKLTTKEIALKALEGDELSLELFRDMADKLHTVLVNINKLIEPDVIVIGGGLTASSYAFWDKMTQGISNVILSTLNGKQVILGALEYCLSH